MQIKGIVLPQSIGRNTIGGNPLNEAVASFFAMTNFWLPSWELILPLPMGTFESMIFLFPGWDTLVPWRLSAIYNPQSLVHVPQAEALRRSQELATEQGVTCNAVGTQETEKSFFR